MQKVVRLPLICEQTDRNGNAIDYKDVYKMLWDLQRQTREIKNKTVQLCWEWQNFSSEYAKNHIADDGKKVYPSEKDNLGYTLSGFVYDRFKSGYTLYSANVSTSSRDVCTAFKNAQTDMLKGDRSVLSYKSNQPLDLHNKAIVLKAAEDGFRLALKLFNRAGVEQYNLKNAEITFKVVAKDNSTKTILERCVDGIYKVSGSKLIYNQKKKLWEFNLSYAFDGKLVSALDEDKILGVDLGVQYPIMASVYGDKKRFSIVGGEVEEFRRRIEARKHSLLKQRAYCGDGSRGHGYRKRTEAVNKISDAIARFRDTANHKYSKALIDYAIKNGAGVNGQLNVHELLHERILALRLLLQNLRHGLALDELGHDGPLAVLLGDGKNFRNRKTGFLHSRLIQRFVQNVRLGILLIEHLDRRIAVPIDGFDVADCYNFIQIHPSAPFSVMRRSMHSGTSA